MDNNAEENISKSEIKRRYKRVEEMAHELAGLSIKNIRELPCAESLREEIAEARNMKAGARKRQVKYIAKILRGSEDIVDGLLDFLEKHKGSKLKEASEFHEVEGLRDAIIDEAISRFDEQRKEGVVLDAAAWQSVAVSGAMLDIPGLEETALKKSALEFARTRNSVHKREIFRMLKAGLERRKFAEKRGDNDGV